MNIETYWAYHMAQPTNDHGFSPETCNLCLHSAEIGDRRIWTEEELHLAD